MKWVQRIALVLVTVLFSSTITFVIIRKMPGDPVMYTAMELQQNQGIPLEDAVRRAKAMLNYDPDIPIARQYLGYMKDVLTGNLGESLAYKTPVSKLIAAGLTWTLFVSIQALAIAFILGTVIGMYVAWRRKTWLEPAVTLWDAVFGAIPPFVIGFLVLVVFAVNLKWFPLRGNYSSSVTPGWNWAFIKSIFYHAFLPVLTYVITGVGTWTLSMKAMSTSVLGEDYIVSARARGLSERRIVFTYVGRNAILPQITALAIAFAGLFAGSTLVENVFVYPGIGHYFGSAISRRDYPLMQGIFLIITVAVVLTNLIAEMLYSVLDPRIREGK